MVAHPVSIRLLVLAVVTLAVSGSGFRFRYEPGRVYRFAYSSRISTEGHVRTSTSATIELQPLDRSSNVFNSSSVGSLMLFKMLDFRLNGTDDAAASYQAHTLSKYPLFFTLQDDPVSETYGLIHDIFEHLHDPLWSVNLKKSILSTLQVHIPENGVPGMLASHENGCPAEVVASMADSGNHVSVSTTLKDGGDCVSEFVVLKAAKNHKLNFFDGRHDEITFSQVAETAPFGNQQMEYSNSFDGSWNFLESLPATSEPTFDQTQMKRSSLNIEKEEHESFKTPLSDNEVRSVIEAAYELQHRGMNDTDLFSRIVMTLKDRTNSLEALQDGLSDQSIRDVLVDGLVATGEEDIIFGLAAHSSLLGFQPKSSDDFLKRIVMNIAYILPTPALFRFVRVLCENDQSFDTKVTAHLTLGAMIHQASSRRGPPLVEAKESLLYLHDVFTEKIDSGLPFLVVLHAIGNAGHTDSVNLLLFIATNKENSVEDRLAALYALRRVDGSKLSKADRENLFKMALNTNGDDQIAWDICRVVMKLSLESGLNNYDLKRIHQVLDGTDALKWKSLLEATLKEIDPKVTGISKLAAILNDMVTISDTPLFSIHDELLIIGSGSMGIFAGYDLAIFNPLHPNGTSHTIVRAEGYTRISALRQRMSLVDALFMFRGDIRNSSDTEKNPVESFIVVSVAGTVWMECINFIGDYCSVDHRRPNFEQTKLQNFETCPFRKETLLFRRNMRFAVFTVTVPIMYGIEVDLTVFAGAQIGFGAAASGCINPYSGVGHLQPSVGLILSGSSRIFAHVVRADATVSLILADTKLNTGFDVTLLSQGKKPIEACSKISLVTNLGKSKALAEVQLRDQVKYCGSTPCGLEWGKPKIWGKSIDIGGDRAHWKKDLREKCLNWPNNMGSYETKSSPILVVQQ